MKNKTIFTLLTLVTFFGLFQPTNAQVRAIYDRGAAGLGQELNRIATSASVMHIAAHPDDEDSDLLSYLARHDHARTVYLALNRGDGGQNVIGDELFESLGVIRTEELLQARRLDGGEQMFTRVMDYGFSKQRSEAARIWGENLVLGDMVRAIRIFRPLVIISRFAGIPRDGHGQHQLAGYLSPIAFKAAADPNMFPEQLKEGLQPWKALKFYRSDGFRPDPKDPPTLTINTGQYDPLLGRTYAEIALEGRSQHKSQEMGTVEYRGKVVSGVKLVDSYVKVPEKESDVFDGINTTLTGYAELEGNGAEAYTKEMTAAQNAINEAIAKFDQDTPAAILPLLVEGYKHARAAAESTKSPILKDFAQRKANDFADAVKRASSIVIDALSDVETINPGGSTKVSVKIFAPENAKLSVKSVSIDAPSGWKSAKADAPTFDPRDFRRRDEIARSSSYFEVTAPNNAQITMPYWLRNPVDSHFLYDWSTAGDSKNMPFAPPLLEAKTALTINGETFEYTQPVEYRYADDIRGEIRRELNVVPKVTIGLESDLLIAPKADTASTYNVVITAKNNTPAGISGKLKLDLPKGWKSKPDSGNFSLPNSGNSTAVTFDVTIPRTAKIGDYPIRAYAEVDGKQFDQEMKVIEYPHIQTHCVYKNAVLNAEVINLKVAPVKVGYIMGSGDKVPDALKRLGVSVTILDKRELSVGDLNRFDTIVVGVRASQVRPDFVANNGRLIDFMKNGGTLIVQYQRNDYVERGLAPYPVEMNGNARTVDENAKVTILDPKATIFNYPNHITDADFNNWVQERHLYSMTGWGKEYKPLLESHDEGEGEIKGGMLEANVGKGKYIFTSYSWFRQLPKGVPGAYRIFANMISQPKAPKE
ncbi:MAG: NEW3 domain-containing protein [Pyrinomonadaceae bacterium]